MRRVLPVLASLLLVVSCAPDPSPVDAGVAAVDAHSPQALPTPSSEPSSLPSAPDEEPVAAATATASPTPSASPSPQALLGPGAETDQVRELQHRLLQIGWFTGTITPSYDEATRSAVEGFQAKRGLPITGEVDQATWDTLVAMTRQPTHDEMHNVLTPGPALVKRGDSGEDVSDLQARLKQIGWFFDKVTGNYGSATEEAVKGFQAKREIPVTGEVDQRTLDRLTAMTHRPTQDELNNILAPAPSSMTLDDRCRQGRVLCISKSQRQLAFVIDGTIQATMDVRFGSDELPTRNGVFSVYMKSRDHVSSLYDTPMPYAMFFSGGQAVHYSADFAARGYNGASHGCVNVRDKGAVMSLFDNVKVGDTVVVF
ncbi:MAG: peptidoglycan-binding protein [Arachnia sp.]